MIVPGTAGSMPSSSQKPIEEIRAKKSVQVEQKCEVHTTMSSSGDLNGDERTSRVKKKRLMQNLAIS